MWQPVKNGWKQQRSRASHLSLVQSSYVFADRLVNESMGSVHGSEYVRWDAKRCVGYLDHPFQEIAKTMATGGKV